MTEPGQNNMEQGIFERPKQNNNHRPDITHGGDQEKTESASIDSLLAEREAKLTDYKNKLEKLEPGNQEAIIKVIRALEKLYDDLLVLSNEHGYIPFAKNNIYPTESRLYNEKKIRELRTRVHNFLIDSAWNKYEGETQTATSSEGRADDTPDKGGIFERPKQNNNHRPDITHGGDQEKTESASIDSLLAEREAKLTDYKNKLEKLEPGNQEAIIKVIRALEKLYDDLLVLSNEHGYIPFAKNNIYPTESRLYNEKKIRELRTRVHNFLIDSAWNKYEGETSPKIKNEQLEESKIYSFTAGETILKLPKQNINLKIERFTIDPPNRLQITLIHKKIGGFGPDIRHFKKNETQNFSQIVKITYLGNGKFRIKEIPSSFNI